MSHPAIGATVEVRRGTRAPGAATLTGRARLMAVMDGQAIDRTIAFLDVHGCRMSAPMQRDAQGWHVHQHELEAVRPPRAEVARA